MATVDDLYDISKAFLDAAKQALDDHVGGSPGRVFVSPGEPALDCCGQLTTWSSSVTEADTQSGTGGTAQDKRGKIGSQTRATIFVQVTRCGPVPKQSGKTITLPEPAALQAAAQLTDEDGWVLWGELGRALHQGGVLAEKCAGATRDTMTKLTPQGACIGWTLTFIVPLQAGPFGT